MVHPAGKPRDTGEPESEARAVEREVALIAHQMLALGPCLVFVIGLAMVVQAFEHRWGSLIALLLPLTLSLGSVRYLRQVFGPATRLPVRLRR